MVPGALLGFFKGGRTLSNRGYSPDCHVHLHTMFYLKKKANKKGGGERVMGTPEPSKAMSLGTTMGSLLASY